MSSPAPFAPIAELLERSLSIRHVYGDPVVRGNTTVIPVAKVAYGFGAGGGRGPHRGRPGARNHDAEGEEHRHAAQGAGAGGGGGVRMSPVGALEIGPDGTRFVRFNRVGAWVGAAVAGLALGWLLGRRRD